MTKNIHWTRTYRKGADKERKIVRQEKAKGRLAFRSAGSHSPVDVVSVDVKAGIIRLIQCKHERFSESQVNKLMAEHHDLNGVYNVIFIVL